MATEIVYREFYDFPHSFIARRKGNTFFFDGPFDEDLDEYPDEFRVYLMTPLSPDDLNGSWEDLHRMSIRDLGTVPVCEVKFDSSRRRSIESELLDRLAQVHDLP